MHASSAYLIQIQYKLAIGYWILETGMLGMAHNIRLRLKGMVRQAKAGQEQGKERQGRTRRRMGWPVPQSVVDPRVQWVIGDVHVFCAAKDPTEANKKPTRRHRNPQGLLGIRREQLTGAPKQSTVPCLIDEHSLCCACLIPRWLSAIQ